MTTGKGRGSNGRSGIPWPVAAMATAFAALAACSTPPAPAKPAIRTTNAFDAVFGELPRIPVQAPAYATVVYFPSAKEPGKFLAAPIFTTESGKEEFLTVRTAVRGIEQEEFEKGVARPLPRGSDLIAFRHERGKATITVGGTFRAASISKFEREKLAAGLGLTVKQFGEVTEMEISDADGTAIFSGIPPAAQVADPGNPRILGLLAIQENRGRPATSLSVLFDRPVFIEEIAISPSGGGSPFPGKSYATGFGMSVEFHPVAGTTFDTKAPYRVRFKVRDGKGRAAGGEVRLVPKEVVRI